MPRKKGQKPAKKPSRIYKKQTNTKIPREKLEKLYEKRRAREGNLSRKERRALKGMKQALLNVWNYIVDPANRISNEDAKVILAFIKDGIGPVHIKEGE